MVLYVRCKRSTQHNHTSIGISTGPHQSSHHVAFISTPCDRSQSHLHQPRPAPASRAFALRHRRHPRRAHQSSRWRSRTHSLFPVLPASLSHQRAFLRLHTHRVPGHTRITAICHSSLLTATRIELTRHASGSHTSFALRSPLSALRSALAPLSPARGAGCPSSRRQTRPRRY